MGIFKCILMFCSIPSKGNVLCGIVGTKRVKFDVWSNDVSFANKMESTGSPDLVHISEETKKFLDDSYIFREAEDVEGHKTYFILGKKNMLSSPSDHGSIQRKLELQIHHQHSSSQTKNLSTTDIPTMSPNAISTSPIAVPHAQHNQSKSLSPSPVLNTRKHRLASISETVTKFLSAAKSSNASATNSEQQKALLEQRKCQPNPTIVIGGICEEASNNNVDNNAGTKVEESPLTTATTINCSVVNNSSGNNIDCDILNDKLVPYNGSTPQQIPPGDAFDVSDDVEQGDGSSLNITDLRSYISQSRCDVSPFSRTGSNRSERTQNNRHSNHYHHQRSNSQQSTLSPWYPQQEFAINLSPSRKDSGEFKKNIYRNLISNLIIKQASEATAEDQVYIIRLIIRIPRSQLIVFQDISPAHNRVSDRNSTWTKWR